MRRAAVAALVLAVLAAAAVLVAARRGSESELTTDARLLRIGELRHVVVPGGSRRPALLVLLHGRSMDPADLLWPELMAEHTRLGARAPALLVVDGGEASYYHDRRDFRWGTHVLRFAIPAARRALHSDPAREAIGGVSMGGFGALDLARLRARPFCAAGGHSPALWRTAGETSEGEFDDAEVIARHDLIRAAHEDADLFHGAPVWLGAGTDDPFRGGDRGPCRRATRGAALHLAGRTRPRLTGATTPPPISASTHGRSSSVLAGSLRG
ncbi:MAG: alpha/beta hydrolase-fold protein [Gaiellaceae bacterium]